MKKTKLSAGSNLLWESSRMILPEHKQLLRRHEKEREARVRPQWDEQQIMIFSEQIVEAVMTKQPVTVELFHLYEQLLITGKITKVNQQEQKFELTHLYGREWVKVQDLIKISK